MELFWILHNRHGPNKRNLLNLQKRKCESDRWQHVGLTRPPQTQAPERVCRVCKSARSPAATAQVRPKQTTITQAFDKGAPYENTSTRWKDRTDAVAFYVAKDMHPIKSVENKGLVRLMKTVDPRYQVPRLYPKLLKKKLMWMSCSKAV